MQSALNRKYDDRELIRCYIFGGRKIGSMIRKGEANEADKKYEQFNFQSQPGVFPGDQSARNGYS
jgi:hypothetical protein